MRIVRILLYASILLVIAPVRLVTAGDLQNHFDSALGLRSRQPDLFAGSPGLLVAAIEGNSKADTLGIRVGDVWLRYNGKPIPSLQSFLAIRSEPQSAGELEFLRRGGLERLALPAGSLGVALVELVSHGLSEADAALFFVLLESGYAGDRDRLMDQIRGQRHAFERIFQHFTELSDPARSGAAQVQHWREAIATFLQLDEQFSTLQQSQKAIEAERSVVAQKLEANREAQLLAEIRRLQLESRQASQAGRHDEALAHARAAVDLARTLPIQEDSASYAPKKASALIQEATSLLQLSSALSTTGEQREAILMADLALQRARSAMNLPMVESPARFAAVVPKILETSQKIEAIALDQLGVLHTLNGDPKAAREIMEQRLGIAISANDRLGRIGALTGIAGSYQEAASYLEAIPYLEEALTLIEDQHDNLQANKVQMALATIYLNLGEHEQAAMHGNKALDAARRFPHRTGGVAGISDQQLRWYAEREAMALDLLGHIRSFWLDEPKQGIRYYQQAAEVAETFLKGTKKQASVLSSLSAGYTIIGRTGKALQYAERALALQQANRSSQTDRYDRKLEATLLTALAEILTSQRKFARAEAYLKRADAITTEDDFQTLIGISEARARALALAGDAAKAEALLRSKRPRITGAVSVAVEN